MAAWIEQNWGNLASVIGLAVSAFAAWRAAGAKVAADAARQAAYARTMGDEIVALATAASDLAFLVASNSFDAAEFRARGLLSETSYFMTRWEDDFLEGTKPRLLESRTQLEVIHNILLERTKLDDEARGRLLQACREVTAVLSEERGKLAKKLAT